MPTFTTSGSMIHKAGENVDSTISGHYILDDWLDEAEAYVNLLCRKDYTTDWASLEANKKNVLREAVSNLVAIYAISYNMSGYTTRVEAEDMINVLWSRFLDCVMLLRDQKSVTDISS